jgi:hypothetical protein
MVTKLVSEWLECVVVQMSVSTCLECVVLKKSVLGRLECVVVKKVSFSMVLIGLRKKPKVNFSMYGMGCGQKVSFPMTGISRGKKVVVKSKFQHGGETAKIYLHGCNKNNFGFTGIGRSNKSQFDTYYDRIKRIFPRTLFYKFR